MDYCCLRNFPLTSGAGDGYCINGAIEASAWNMRLGSHICTQCSLLKILMKVVRFWVWCRHMLSPYSISLNSEERRRQFIFWEMWIPRPPLSLFHALSFLFTLWPRKKVSLKTTFTRITLLWLIFWHVSILFWLTGSDWHFLCFEFGGYVSNVSEKDQMKVEFFV